MKIRNEVRSDYREVEELTRKAFWNLYCPGCSEHYLVHVMRSHEDFIAELDLVLESDNSVIANIMYTKAKIMDENGHEKTVLTFGPLSVLPGYQRKGFGKMLMEYSFKKAAELGYDTIAIYGNPENYVSSGFRCCKHYNISVGDHVFPTAFLIKELCEGAVPAGTWTYHGSHVYEIDNRAAKEFDQTFEPRAEEYRQSQELFYIYSHSQVF